MFSSLLLLAGITSLADAQEKKKTFAVIPVQLANPFFAEIERGAKEQSAKLGVNLIYTASATSDQAGQVQVFRDIMTRGVNGIAIAPVNGEVLVGVIGEARKRGISVVMMNGDSPHSERQAYVGTDQLTASRKAGEVFRSLHTAGRPFSHEPKPKLVAQRAGVYRPQSKQQELAPQNNRAPRSKTRYTGIFTVPQKVDRTG